MSRATKDDSLESALPYYVGQRGNLPVAILFGQRGRLAVWSAALFFGKRCCENPLHHFFEALLSRPAASFYLMSVATETRCLSFDERGYRPLHLLFDESGY